MKQTKSQTLSDQNLSFESYPVEDLLRAVPVFLEVNLEDPETEAVAREFLAELRKKGCEIQEADLDCEGCAACLHLSLMSALSYLAE